MDHAYAPTPTATSHPDIQAIIARPPAKLTRWGSGILLLIVSGLLAATAFVRYAERISVPLQLAAATAPVMVPVPQATYWCVQPKQWVRQGDVLGYTTNGASVPEVLQLAQWLRQPAPAPAANGSATGQPSYTQLGELQATYNALGQRLQLGPNNRPDKPAYALHRAGLQRQVQQWLAAHAIRAPASGYLSHETWKTSTTAAGQATEMQRYLLPVVRPGTEVGHILIAQSQLRYIQPQQWVEVSFDAYPAGEYGSVRGRIEQIADLPEANGYYQALVRFPQGLRTNNRHTLSFRTGMRASAEIVLAYKPLIQRLFPALAKSS